ncbi:MAG: hypothetical protein HY928_01490 [Elusimicrobia bacterium]|nr:hypothetical protein [Elusimicrobiota bacterium]
MIRPAALACLSALAFPASASAAAPEAIRAAQADAAQATDALAREFAFFLLRADAALTEQGVKKPAHREAFLVPKADALGADLIRRSEDGARAALALWKSKAPALFPTMAEFYRLETDRLAEFVRADPDILLNEIPLGMGPQGIENPASLMAAVAAATEKADAGPGFGKRLQRAKAAGDLELARVAGRRVSLEARAVGDGLADAWLDFAAAAGGSLQGIDDLDTRRAVLGPQASKTGGEFLGRYDRFAAAMRTSFAKAGRAAADAAEAAVALERARLERFFAADFAALETERRRALKAELPADGRSVRRSLETRAAMAVAGEKGGR